MANETAPVPEGMVLMSKTNLKNIAVYIRAAAEVYQLLELEAARANNEKKKAWANAHAETMFDIAKEFEAL